MSWTYDPALSAARDRVRFMVGDTDSTDEQLQNEEIDYLLTTEVSETSAAIAACQALIAKYSRRVDRQVGSLKISSSKLVDHYTALVETLSVAAARRGVPTAGGVYQSEKDAAAASDALVQPAIRRGIHDF